MINYNLKLKNNNKYLFKIKMIKVYKYPVRL